MTRRLLAVAIILPTLLLVYAITALVRMEGGPGTLFAFKPFHGVYPFYGGGEEGGWARDHPDQPMVWFLTQDYVTLFSSSAETTTPVWEHFYASGY